MKKIFVVFTLIFSVSLFGQNIKYRSLVTERQKKEILGSLSKNNITLKETRQEYQIFRKGELYAILSKNPKYVNFNLGGDEISLFELKCKELKEEFFGTILEFRDIEAIWEKRVKFENQSSRRRSYE